MPLLGIHSKELKLDIQTKIYTQKVETTHMSINKWIDKMWCSYGILFNEILFTPKEIMKY